MDGSELDGKAIETDQSLVHDGPSADHRPLDGSATDRGNRDSGADASRGDASRGDAACVVRQLANADMPGDINSDGLYEDINGNGNGNGRRDFADVTAFNTYLAWIQANECLDAFDFDKNGDVDSGDKDKLFNDL